MLDCWGYLYVGTGTALAYAETALEQQRARTGGELAGHGTSTLDPNEQAALLVEHKCDEILHLMDGYLHELGPIPTNLELLKAKLQQSRKPHQLKLFTNDILDDVRRIKNDFLVLLEQRKFYYIGPGLSRFYGQPILFGEAVAAKFKEARMDVEHAGNCLALGEPTACVFHLMRAMESVVRKLGERLKVTINPKDTWGIILKNMDKGIEALPEKNKREKRKKEQWSECRANLWHVKQAWRDNSMHAKITYSDREAREILERVRSFMQHLATL